MAWTSNCVGCASISVVVIVLCIYGLDGFLYAENQSSVVRSLQNYILRNDGCRHSYNSTSIQIEKAQIYSPHNFTCNCSNSVISACPPSAIEVVEKEVVKEIEKPCPAPEVKTVRHQPWYAEGRVWHYPTMFPRCTMDACFNYSRCDDMDDLKIFSYVVPSPPFRYYSHLNKTKWYTDNPDQACLFLIFLDTEYPWPPQPRELPHWDGGMNHVLVSFADEWRQKHVPEDSIGFASLLLTDMHETIYRPGFDISMTLPPFYRSHQFQNLKPSERKYILTFRGLRYLGHNEEGILRSEDSFREMHNGNDVIVAVSCKHPINDLKRQKEPALGIHCEEDERIHANYSYGDLMNSTFGLAPAGIQPNSYRFTEILSAGTIPVLIADNYVKPFDTLIQWHKCLLQFPTTEMRRIVPTLRKMTKEEMEKRQEYCLKVYDEYLKDDEALLKAVIDSLKARFMGVLPHLTPLDRL
eukprot:Gb_02632 [translate_table: standard]